MLLGALLTGDAGRHALPITILAAVMAWLTTMALDPARRR